MKLHFVWVGKTRNQHWLALQQDYLKRLSHFVKYEITEIKDNAAYETPEDEGKRILKKVNQTAFVCLLDIKGRQVGSLAMAKKLEKWQIRGLKEITFVIGGAEGVSSEVVERADFSLSLSLLTLTHEMARVVLIEQIYRAYTIIKGYPYQK